MPFKTRARKQRTRPRFDPLPDDQLYSHHALLSLASGPITPTPAAPNRPPPIQPPSPAETTGPLADAPARARTRAAITAPPPTSSDPSTDLAVVEPWAAPSRTEPATAPRRPPRPAPSPTPRGPGSSVGSALGERGGPRHRKREPEPEPSQIPIDPVEAGGLAVTFALDLLAWDEDDLARRAGVLARYLPAEVVTETLGWDGVGMLRSELGVPMRVSMLGEALVRVEVRVRVTPYERLGDFHTGPLPGTERPGATSCQLPGAVPASAPAPWRFGWHPRPSEWVVLHVPVGRNPAGDLIVALDERSCP